MRVSGPGQGRPSYPRHPLLTLIITHISPRRAQYAQRAAPPLSARCNVSELDNGRKNTE